MASINDCKSIQLRLSEYVDGALSEEAAWKVKMHLASCAVCARVAADFRATAGLLGALPRVETSASFEAALARRLADQVLQPRRAGLGGGIRAWWSSLTPRARPVLAAAGALAAVGPVAGFLVAKSAQDVPAQRVTAVASEQQFVEQCLDAHAAYAAADPLGDPAAVLLAASPKMAEGDGEAF